jgi:HK97 family phage portal protein
VAAESSVAVVPHRAPLALSPRIPRFAATRPAASPNLAEVTSWPYFGTPRAAALSIPTVSTCRDLIVGAVVQMELHRYRDLDRIEKGKLLTQPDPDTTWAATIAGVVEDLIYDGRAYLLVLARDGISTERNPDGLPVRARWIPTTAITPEVSRSTGAYSRLDGYRVQGISGIVEPQNVIRFDSPLPGRLAHGADAIANALELEAKAARLSSVDLPAGVITNEGAEIGETDADELIARFEAARAEHTVAFLQNAKYERTELSAEDLQLIEARANAATEMARLHNVPVALVAASPSGGASAMLYSNLGSQLALLVSNAVAPYLAAIEQTLSRDDVSPQGNRVAFDVAAFLRSDPDALKTYVIELLEKQVIDRVEARAMLGIASPTNLQPGTV